METAFNIFKVLMFFGIAWMVVRQLYIETIKEYRKDDKPEIKECDHKWGTDGQHSNIYCKKCFISEEEYEEKTGNIVEMD
jgi:hypothetical protein